MRIYLIRHADPDYEHDSLTPAGHLEAQALAERLAEIGIDEIYASPRGRAQLTARYTAERLGLPVTIEPWTNELDGVHSPLYTETSWDVDPVVLRSPGSLAGWSAGQPLPPMDVPILTQHLAAIRAGSDDFLCRLGFRRDTACPDAFTYHFTPDAEGRGSRKRIALFAHLGFGLTWLSGLLGIPLPVMWAGFYVHPSSVTTILFDERTPGCATPRLLGLGDISHLVRAGLPPSRKGIIANVD